MKVINVVAAIIKKEEEVFITQRGHGEFKGVWEFPGGNLELTEHLDAKPELIGKEREALGEAIAEKYRNSNL